MNNDLKKKRYCKICRILLAHMNRDKVCFRHEEHKDYKVYKNSTPARQIDTHYSTHNAILQFHMNYDGTMNECIIIERKVI